MATTTVRKCGKCGQGGHDKRTCPQGAQVAAMAATLVAAPVTAPVVDSTLAPELTAAVKPFRPSAEQQAFFDLIQHGTGHVILRARAGCGKTTTIVASLGYILATLVAMVCAFGRKIAQELGARISTPNASVSTLHQIGLRGIRHYKRHVPIDFSGTREQGLAAYVCGDQVPLTIQALVAKLCTKGREIQPLTRRWEELLDLAYQFECVPDDEWILDGFTAEFVAQKAYDAMLLAACEAPFQDAGLPCIDGADMIYLPLRKRWMSGEKYDFVVVDEAQDMTNAQLELARRIVRSGTGRIVIVGDDRQGIYAFRGADSQALDRLKAELAASPLGVTELPLATTYRCGKAIVRVAAKYVPDFTAAEGNPEGEVLHLPIGEALKLPQPGDFVVSRKNAPLTAVAMRLLREGRRVRIEGKEIGKGIQALVRKLAGKVNSLPAFLGKLATWEEKQKARALKMFPVEGERQTKELEKVADMAETLRVLAAGLAGVSELITRIDSLFSDFDEVGNPASFVTLSSVHKAKGLEADTVILLWDTFKGTGTSDISEENNLCYVAITRAKLRLVFAEGLL